MKKITASRRYVWLIQLAGCIGILILVMPYWFSALASVKTICMKIATIPFLIAIVLLPVAFWLERKKRTLPHDESVKETE
jgi:hypothetical protein